jgi:hypothetical protein
MPRKQRFKPSRKPKPIPVNEDAALGHQDKAASVPNEKAPIRESSQSPEADSVSGVGGNP